MGMPWPTSYLLPRSTTKPRLRAMASSRLVLPHISSLDRFEQTPFCPLDRQFVGSTCPMRHIDEPLPARLMAAWRGVRPFGFPQRLAHLVLPYSISHRNQSSTTWAAMLIFRKEVVFLILSLADSTAVVFSGLPKTTVGVLRGRGGPFHDGIGR